VDMPDDLLLLHRQLHRYPQLLTSQLFASPCWQAAMKTLAAQ
jgi:hypothetical protein